MLFTEHNYKHQFVRHLAPTKWVDEQKQQLPSIANCFSFSFNSNSIQCHVCVCVCVCVREHAIVDRSFGSIDGVNGTHCALFKWCSRQVHTHHLLHIVVNYLLNGTWLHLCAMRCDSIQFDWFEFFIRINYTNHSIEFQYYVSQLRSTSFSVNFRWNFQKN